MSEGFFSDLFLGSLSISISISYSHLRPQSPQNARCVKSVELLHDCVSIDGFEGSSAMRAQRKRGAAGPRLPSMGVYGAEGLLYLRWAAVAVLLAGLVCSAASSAFGNFLEITCSHHKPQARKKRATPAPTPHEHATVGTRAACAHVPPWAHNPWVAARHAMQGPPAEREAPWGWAAGPAAAAAAAASSLAQATNYTHDSVEDAMHGRLPGGGAYSWATRAEDLAVRRCRVVGLGVGWG